ncbi:MAG: hypothetical protein AAGA68_09015 [Pseudomonadota bacterium]
MNKQEFQSVHPPRANRWFGALGTILALLPLVAVQAARPVDPPSVELTRGTNNVVAATVLDKPNLTHMKLRVDSLLSGTAEEAEFSVRAEEGAFGDLVIGQRYLVAFTRVGSNDQFRDAKFLDPEGPRVLRLRGGRIATVFPDTPALRFLFSRARGDRQPSDRERLDAVLTLISEGGPRNQAFAIEELYVRNELGPVFEAQDIEVIKAALARHDLPLQLRQFLLDAAAKFPGGPAAPWLHEEHRKVLLRAGPQLDLVSAQALLVVTALKGLATANDARDLSVVLPMLGANSPSVVREALGVAHAMDQPATLVAVQQQLEAAMFEEGVHADTRRLLEQYVLGELGVIDDEDAR